MKSLRVPDEAYERLQDIATDEATTVEVLATKALERKLARRRLARTGLEGQARRVGLPDDEVDPVVAQAVQEDQHQADAHVSVK